MEGFGVVVIEEIWNHHDEEHDKIIDLISLEKVSRA